MKISNFRTASRREFLSISGGAVLGGATVALADTPTASPVVEQGAESLGYRETDHIRTFYQLARF